MAAITGRITINNKAILEVDAVPSAGAGTVASIGSLSLFDTGVVGSLYVKTGALDTAWSQVDTPEGQDWELSGNALTGGLPTTPNEFFGSTNDFDVAFQRNNTELMRIAADGILIGLSATLGGRLQISPSALGADLLRQSGPNGGAGARVVHVTRQFKVQTTNATIAALASVTIADATRVQGHTKIMARQHGGAVGAVGDGADYIGTFSAKRDGGGAILNAISTDFTEEDINPAFTVSVASNVNDIDINVTGALNRNIAWSAHMELVIGVD